MAQQDTFAEKATGMWGQQMDRWVESATLCQAQMETFLNLWVNQMTEAQKESQKFLKEWTASATKTQAELWKAWQANVKEGGQLFGAGPAPK